MSADLIGTAARAGQACTGHNWDCVTFSPQLCCVPVLCLVCVFALTNVYEPKTLICFA